MEAEPVFFFVFNTPGKLITDIKSHHRYGVMSSEYGAGCSGGRSFIPRPSPHPQRATNISTTAFPGYQPTRLSSYRTNNRLFSLRGRQYRNPSVGPGSRHEPLSQQEENVSLFA
jgi:hypothetical protein